MRKSSILLACAAVALLALGGALAITRHAKASARPNPMTITAMAEKTAAPDEGSQPDADDDSPPKTIQFVAHPVATPPFMLTDFSGKPVSSANFPGKVVILSFWATWCPPCREEIPNLIKLAAEYKDRLEIVGISMDDNDSPEDAKKVQAFVAKMGMNYPVLMASKDLVREYGGVPALPTTFVLDKQGRVVQKHVGLIPQQIYEAEIRSLLGEPVSAKVETFEDTGQVFLKNAALATELPGVDFSGLTDEQKKAALKDMNTESCTCGCGLTVAECRINDSSCDVSKAMAAKIIEDVKNRGHNPDEVIHH